MIDMLDSYELKVTHDTQEEFQKAISLALAKDNKQISSKYLYDERGCELFNQITRHPDYYLTNCELEILQSYGKRLAQLTHSEPFNLIELGPGEGIKTQILIEQFLHDKLNFSYLPIDISTGYLKRLSYYLAKQIPRVKVTAIHADYFRGLEWINANSINRNMVMFLGSSIGNFDPLMTHEFLRHLWASLKPGDYVLVGFDLRKNIDVLMRAYDDDQGITRAFNLNLLDRMNRELEANFIKENFYHYATYNVHSAAMESYLISLEPQTIYCKAIDQTISLHKMEAIHVENSYKYHFEQIADFAQNAGFSVVENFMDKRGYFADSLWQVEK